MTFFAGMAVVGVLQGPTWTAQASGLVERHVMAELDHDTAQQIGIKTGRAVAREMDLPKALTVVTTQSDGECVIMPVQVSVDCETKVFYGYNAHQRYVVTVERRSETFTYDSALVAAQ